MEEKIQEKKARKKKKLAKKIRIEKFDKAVISEITQGNYSARQISEKLHVDYQDMLSRLQELLDEKYLILNEEQLRLGVRGFNFFPTIKVKTQTVKEKPRKERETDAALESNLSQGKVDLHEMLERGAPHEVRVGEKPPWVESPMPQQKEQKEKPRKKETTETSSPNLPAKQTDSTQQQSNEKCELCKSDFKLSTGKENNPKYGHCFCGAAYHKDCFESIMDSTGKCARCGKLLEIKLNKESEEAVSKLKKLF